MRRANPSMSRLLATLMTSLLWASASIAHAHQLVAPNPVRASLVDLARSAPTPGLPAYARLTLSRAWVEGSQAKVCALATAANGDLLVQDGHVQMKRVHLRKHGSRWGVERAERIVLGPNMSVEAACGQPSSETIMASAIKLLQTHPPASGGGNSSSKAKTPAATTANCHTAEEPGGATTQPTGPGSVSLPGRSLLHTAPDLACFMGKHIVGGDKVVILAHVPGWTRVRYTHPLTNIVTVGWLKSERVKMDQVSDQRASQP